MAERKKLKALKNHNKEIDVRIFDMVAKLFSRVRHSQGPGGICP